MSSSNKDGEVLEGFLCPICMEDLTSITQLQAHFEEVHESEDKSGLKSFIGLISKAKRKLLNDDEEDKELSSKLLNPFSPDTLQNSVYDPWQWAPPDIVPGRSHCSDFKRIRSQRIDSFVAETNKLIIRLDKLLNRMPSDSSKRKAHEKDVVSWVENKDVPLCPFCARSFNIARRRHHCRLCGAIMCDDCSQFLSISHAEKLISPVHQGDTSTRTPNSASEDKGVTASLGSFISNIPGLKRSNSHGSLNSILSSVDAFGKEKAFRICSHCLDRLSAREKQVEKRSSKPLLAVYYSKLMEHKKQLVNLLPQYLKMVDSLTEGESTYHYSDVEQLRLRILKLSDTINMIGVKIRNLGAAGVALESEDTPVSPDGEVAPAFPRQEILQRRIHSSTVAFLKEEVLGLPKLPSVEVISKKREMRRKEMDERLAFEREAAKVAEAKAFEILRRKKANDVSAKTSPKRTGSLISPSHARQEKIAVVYDNGWGAETSAHLVTETDDPIVQQMNVIRNYMRQAREACKYDELSMLEANLIELQIEYKKTQSATSK